MINFKKIKNVKIIKEEQWVYDICCANTKKFFVRHKNSNKYQLVHNTSMYPSIMRSLKISPETFLCKVQSNYDDIVKNIRPYLVHGKNNSIGELIYEVKFFNNTIRRLPLKELKKWLDNNIRINFPITMSPNGSIFKYTNEAIIPKIQENLAGMRNTHKSGKKVSEILSKKLKEMINE